MSNTIFIRRASQPDFQSFDIPEQPGSRVRHKIGSAMLIATILDCLGIDGDDMRPGATLKITVERVPDWAIPKVRRRKSKKKKNAKKSKKKPQRPAKKPRQGRRKKTSRAAKR